MGKVNSHVNANIVDYIQSNGTDNQYINTSYVPNDNSVFEIVFKIPSFNKPYMSPFGTRYENADNCYVWFQSNRVYTGWGNTDSLNVTMPVTTGVKYKMTFSKGYLKIENCATGSVIAETTFTAATINTNRTVYLFTNNDIPNINGALFTIYSFKVKENDTVVKNLKSVIVNGVGAMVDKLNGEYFYNAGTGSFAAGLE